MLFLSLLKLKKITYNLTIFFGIGKLLKMMVYALLREGFPQNPLGVGYIPSFLGVFRSQKRLLDCKLFFWVEETQKKHRFLLKLQKITYNLTIFFQKIDFETLKKSRQNHLNRAVCLQSPTSLYDSRFILFILYKLFFFYFYNYKAQNPHFGRHR